MPMVRTQVGDFRYHDRVPLTSHLDGRPRGGRARSSAGGPTSRPGAVLMPSFVNIGAYVDTGTMVDTWATVGSGAQIGKNVHLSGGVGIGGVLEPVNAVPVVVEDDAFISSRCMVVEGARVRTGAVLGAGHHPDPELARHRRADRRGTAARRGAGLVGRGRRHPAPRKFPGGEFGMPCVLVLRRLPEGGVHDKAALNDILRDHGVNA